MKLKNITRHLLIVLFFGIIANSTYIAGALAGAISPDSLDAYFFGMRTFNLFHMLLYAYVNYYLLRKWIDKKISFPQYLFQFHLLLFIVIFSVNFLGKLLGSYLCDCDQMLFKINNKAIINTIFYYYTYVNILAGIIFLPRLISRYKLRNQRLEIEMQEQKALSLQTNLFTELFSHALTAIKNQEEKVLREKQIIQLSDFLRFIIYETDVMQIPISKVQLILNLYAKIIRASFQNIELHIENKISDTQLNLSTKKLLRQLQIFTQHTLQNNNITKAQLQLFKLENESVIFGAKFFSNAKQKLAFEEIVA